MTTEEKRQKPTIDQAARILQMMSGDNFKIDRALAQAIIQGDARIMTEDDRRIAYWEQKFPGKGAAIMEILRPFYAWKPELKPTLPDLEARVKQAVSWREITDVRVFPLDQRESLQSLYRDSLGESLLDSIRYLLDTSLRSSLWDSFEQSLWGSLEVSLWDVLRDRPRYSFRDLLYSAVLCVVAGRFEKAEKLQDLFALYFAGNFPVGFDECGKLLVLTA